MRDAVVSGGDTPELFELAYGPFDPIAQLVFDRIEGAFSGHACALWDNRLGARGFDEVEDRVGIVSFVRQNVLGGEAG